MLLKFMPSHKTIAKIIKIIESDVSPAQIAGGFSLGLIIGLTPLWNLHNLFLLFLVLIIRINWAILVIFFGIFSAFSFAIDPLYHSIGMKLLTEGSLQIFWTKLYNTPTVTWTHFNNSIVLGSLVFSVLLAIPGWFAMRWFVIGWREGWLKEWLEKKWKLVTKIKNSRFYKWYMKAKEDGITKEEVKDYAKQELEGKIKDTKYYKQYEKAKEGVEEIKDGIEKGKEQYEEAKEQVEKVKEGYEQLKNYKESRQYKLFDKILNFRESSTYKVFAKVKGWIS